MLKDPQSYDFINGEILLIDKEVDWTSFDVVGYIRAALNRLLKIKKIKIGHAGTLDPKASGLLILCTGKFTKRINEFQDLEKEYTGTFRFGTTTPSFDMETDPEEFFPWEHINEASLEAVRPAFTGLISQVPPAYSAIHISGKRAYELARKDNAAVKIGPREVHIHHLEFTRFAFPEVDFLVRCSKGTYIRSLARDIGTALGSGAFLTKLRRTAIGDFRVDNAVNAKTFLNNLSR